MTSTTIFLNPTPLSNGLSIPTTLPIGVVPPMVNQQQSIFQLHLPPRPIPGSPQKNILLSPITSSVIHLGMVPGLEQSKRTSSINGKNDEENLPPEEREKLKIKREKNALASRRCRLNKIRQIHHWETQAKLTAQKLNATEIELGLLKDRHQALLLYLKRTDVPLPPQFASDLLPTNPETSVEETSSMIQPNHVVHTDELHTNTQLALPNIISAIQLPSTSSHTDQMELVSITEHNETVQEWVDTVLASGSPLNYQMLY